MSKPKKEKTASKRKILALVVIAFAVAPLLINVGLVITDFIYDKTGTTLTAYGLNNVEWLDFWKQYLAISISFLGVYLVYISSSKDREMQLREKDAQHYLEKVRREEEVLVDVVQSFNIGVVYDALLQQARSNIYEGRKVLADSRVNMDLVHIKFELLTDLCDDFKKCEKCSYSVSHYAHKSSRRSSMDKMLRAWLTEAKKLETGESTKEEYDDWRYKYPELDTHQIWAKVPSQELFDMLEKELKNTKKGEQT